MRGPSLFSSSSLGSQARLTVYRNKMVRKAKPQGRADTVEVKFLMGKYIYKITNDVNGKVYIGQSNNPQRRFTEHSHHKENSLIHQAIVKYGKEHFHLDILGYFEDYNSKEEYYINYFKSLTPEGYNIAPGGEAPPIHYGKDNPATVISEEIANYVKQDLLNFDILRKDIRKKYNITEDILRHINEGNSWRDNNLNYPLRPSEHELTEQKAQEVKRLLKTSKLTQKQIADKFGLKRSFVTMINIGQNHYDPNENYPLRSQKITNNTPVKEIKNMLLATDIPMNKIAEHFHVKSEVVYNINKGKTYKDASLNYPLRK